jgi:hypothetical protein
MTVTRIASALALGNYVPFTWSDIQINRIDLCVNQHYASKEESLRALHHMKQIRKKYSRIEGRSNEGLYKTALTHLTKRYYAKIYHKGTEFEQIQTKHLMELNQKRKASGQKQIHSDSLKMRRNGENFKEVLKDIDQDESLLEMSEFRKSDLQEYADKILRFELEFKSQYLSYIFNYKNNKQWSEEFKACVSLYNFYEKNEHLKRNVFSVEKRYVDLSGKEHKKEIFNYAKIVYYYKVWDGDKQVYSMAPVQDRELTRLLQLKRLGINNHGELTKFLKYMKKELTMARVFTFAIPKNIPDTTVKHWWNPNTGEEEKIFPFDETPNQVRFTKSMLYDMLASLEAFWNNFQVRSKGKLDEFEDKMDQYKQDLEIRIKNSISKKEQAKLMRERISERQRRNLLQYRQLSNLSMVELVPKNYSRATYHRIRKLYNTINGSKEQIVNANFSDHIQTNFKQAYSNLYTYINNEAFLSVFYNSGFRKLDFVRIA